MTFFVKFFVKFQPNFFLYPADSDTIMRRNTAIRSFTESVDSDFPPAPELPPSLNIDLRYPEEAVKRSETSDTIIEVSLFLLSSLNLLFDY